MGMLQAVLTPQQIAALVPPVTPYQMQQMILADPGPHPEYPVGVTVANSTNAQREVFLASSKEWNRLSKQHSTLSQGYAILKDAVFNSLPHHIQQKISDPEFGIINKSVLEILIEVDKDYVVDNVEILKQKALLETLYDTSSDLNVHINKMITIFKFIKALTAIELPEYEKVDCLERSMSSASDYSQIIKFFLMKPDNEQTFTILSASLLKEFNRTQKGAIMGSNAATALPSMSDLQIQNAALLAQNALLVANTKKSAGSTRSQPKTGQGAGAAASGRGKAGKAAPTSWPVRNYTLTVAPNGLNFYCWTHGHCKHHSADCTDRYTNHVSAATHLNQMGGNPY